MSAPAKTLYDKLWDDHVVADEGDGVCLLYIDRQILHEVSSPVAFAGLEARGASVRRPKAQLATVDHAIPTKDRDKPVADPLARSQIALLENNATAHGITLYGSRSPRQGIVHVVGPEQGFTQPGMTLVCGDSHTATHGAFGTLAFGVGTSEIECVLATQTLRQSRSRNMALRATGTLGRGISAKDLAMAAVGRIGAGGGSGYAIEYMGAAISAMSMAARMTLCNMTIEAGSRIGMVAPDETTFAFLEGRPFAPKGPLWDEAVAYWRTLPSDTRARFDRVLEIDAGALAPQVTWGARPDLVLPVTGRTPHPDNAASAPERESLLKSLAYMGLTPDTALQDISIDYAFIGSCTNSRLEDLRAAAEIVAGKRVAKHVTALVVPGSSTIKRQAEAEGLDLIFRQAGFEWRDAGCSLCVAMNNDRLAPGQRSASTSNRNFEGRQGPGARTHLMSPMMVAAAAIAGHIVDVREIG
ncbi:3-isopropylmalate dehydratase large subunit [Caulobacter sp. 602-1]|uniref:3-isopropylmalate dehydratase large subunit n=1 Tax=Caulobacter sp. 602-1 TaxID=2492472 RepID=UPI000F63970C|nr:3-isopropylmalate dehydratase large subunit [Caulobacter sp. 602-1]RRN66032.1 3-isopropylmalate dehydratase large subunit [Caulobacter sp. 602-1]